MWHAADIAKIDTVLVLVVIEAHMCPFLAL